MKLNTNIEYRAATLREQLKADLWEALMYSGKPLMPKTKKPEATVKKATTGGHKTFQKRASRKIGQ
jgi:hypothetical protein